MLILFYRGSLVLVALALAVAGAGRMFSNFQRYDDEGYIHYAINAYAEHGGLYDKIESQYGPFFHLSHHALHGLGLPFNANGGRALMLLYWLATVGFSGAIVWRLTRSTVATIFALGGVFMHLTSFVNEPTHPGGIAAAMVAALAWFGTTRPDRPAQLAAAAGAIGCALVLTKINVGVFVFAGAGAWWLVHLAAGQPGLRAPAWIAGVLLVAMPIALLGGKIGVVWVATFAVVAGVAAAAVVLAAASGAPSVAAWRNLLPLSASALLVGAVSIVGAMANDTSFMTVLRGVLLDPLRHPDLFTVPVDWQGGAVPVAIASAGGAVWAATSRSTSVRRVVAAGRVAALAGFAFLRLGPWEFDTGSCILSYGLGLTWLFVFPLNEDHRCVRARAWVALLLVTQALQAYPVAGSQVAWGTFLWIPLAVAGAHEAMSTAWFARLPGSPRIKALAGIAVVSLVLFTTATMARYGRNLLRYGDPLELPGATWVRLQVRQSSTLRVLALNARVHGDMLFSVPGQLSFNHWSGVRTPTLHNNTHWFTLLSGHEQDEIRARLETSPRSVVIFQHEELAGLAKKGVAIETPLMRWIRENYAPAFRLGAYEFAVRQGRRIAAVGTAVVRDDQGARSVAATLALPANQEVATIELHRFKGIATEKLASWPGAGARRSHAPAVDPVASEGGILTMELAAPDFPRDLPPMEAILYFFDAAGQRVAEARLL